MKNKQINTHSKRIKIILMTALLCMMMFNTACMYCSYDDPHFTPIEDYDADLQSKIIGKWKLVGKSINSAEDYTDAVEDDKYIEFTKIENSVYGNYISNMAPENLYYIVTKNIGIYFYTSLDSHNIMHPDYRIPLLQLIPNDTLFLTFSVGSGWFDDKSKYIYYFFTKMENE